MSDLARALLLAPLLVLLAVMFTVLVITALTYAGVIR